MCIVLPRTALARFLRQRKERTAQNDHWHQSRIASQHTGSFPWAKLRLEREQSSEANRLLRSEG